MTIKIIAVGKLKEKYLKKGIAEYTKRLGRYTKFKIIEVSDEHAPENLSDADIEIIKDVEGERILKKIGSREYVIALDLKGTQKTSEKMAKDLGNLFVQGKSNITYVIGGSLGLSTDVLNRAQERQCFSLNTFPHQLMRLILVEQIYRCFRINKGEPYHK